MIPRNLVDAWSSSGMGMLLIQCSPFVVLVCKHLHVCVWTYFICACMH